MKNKSLVTKARFIDCEKRILNSHGTFFRVLWFFFALLWAGAIVLFSKILESPFIEIFLCAVVIAYCIYKIALDSIARAHFRYFIWTRRTGMREWTREVRLEEEYIAVFDAEYKSTYKYSQIKEITQFEAEIALILYNKQAIMISTGGFTDCTLEEFLAKIVVKKENGF